MIYILEDGRILPDKSLIENEKYIELAEYPEPVYQDGMVGVIIGIENNAIKYEFVEESVIEEPTSEPTEIEILNAKIDTLAKIILGGGLSWLHSMITKTLTDGDGLEKILFLVW